MNWLEFQNSTNVVTRIVFKPGEFEMANKNTCVYVCVCIYIYIYHHHHQVVLIA